MEQLGEFTENINRLESNWASVRSVWTDQTALTYNDMHENMKGFAAQIHAYSENSVAGYNAVKANYNESEFDRELNDLGSKVAAI